MADVSDTRPPELAPTSWRHDLVIGLIAFLTVVDLFATQAILPALTDHYHVSRAAMGFAVNASTMGMAVSGLLTALLSRHIPRRAGVVTCLALLTIPTALLALAPDLATFTALRIAQGVLMAAAFTLTLAYLGEQCSAAEAAGAFAAYITGNVASNLVGRLISASLADRLGLDINFYVFAVLNLAGALLAYRFLTGMAPMLGSRDHGSSLDAMRRHLGHPALRRAFAIGFCILFAFIGTFTYANFVLVAPPLSVGAMQLGFVYFVFLPSIVTTPLAGWVVARLGVRLALILGLALAGAGLPLLVVESLPAVLVGLVLVGVGTFAAQATATGFVSRTTESDRGAASGLYLASYFLGGLVGAALLGQIFDRLGWPACVLTIGLALALACGLSSGLDSRPAHGRSRAPAMSR
jgi:predicted MFS family arabinose efflux permease